MAQRLWSAAAAAPTVADTFGADSDEDDEDDYLSDKFLAGSRAVLTGGKVDPRWDLPKWKRKAAQLDKAARDPPPRKRSLKEHEADHRRQGLGAKLDASNKGFAMLAKMGYTAGAGLGKGGSGRAEPVGVELRVGRGGFGLETAKRKRSESMIAVTNAARARRVRATADLQLDFQQRKRHEYREKQALRDLPAAQLACETLDVEQGLSLSDLWFRPPPEPVSDEDGNPIVPIPEGGATATTEAEAFGKEPGGFATLEASEQLIIVTRYLREAYGYCQWCGTRYHIDELEKECPGDTRDDHE